VGAIRGVWVIFADPSGGQTCSSAMSFDAPLCPLSYKMAHINIL